MKHSHLAIAAALITTADSSANLTNYSASTEQEISCQREETEPNDPNVGDAEGTSTR